MPSKVICIENQVHRPAGPWTKQVQSFLRFLHCTGFKAVPEPLGFTKEGLEIVSFVTGQTCDYPLSADVKSIEALCSSAQLLRRYHDASQPFLNACDISIQKWMFPCRYPQEVICHNDFAPYNICFVEQKAVGIIDFDTAHPGPRVWDIAYALYRFAPFTSLENHDGFGNLTNQILRACLFLDAYGLDVKSRAKLASLMVVRLEELVHFLVTAARQGDQKYECNMQEGHHLLYLSDIQYIRLNKKTIEEGLANNECVNE